MSISTLEQRSFSACIVIPCYNHGNTMAHVLTVLDSYNLPCIIVNDGSDQQTSIELQHLSEKYHWVRLVNHTYNQGKGAAVVTGLREAWNIGASHAIQVDADGQHQLSDLPTLLEKAKRYPDDVISGKPIYDASVPRSRFYARYITHVWVWIETLSLSIKDSMCGFRVYPLKETLATIDKAKTGRHMDFDTEILVRLYWAGCQIHFVPTKVIYPENGISHFNALHDNLKISLMHSRLFLQMLPKMPKLICRNITRSRHWSQASERKGLWGMRFMLKAYRLFGRTGFKILLYPVIIAYWLTGKSQRKASQQYIKQLKDYTMQLNKPLPSTISLNSFHHFMQFGESILDKLAGWHGDISLKDVVFNQQTLCLDQLKTGKGLLILGSHLGDIELCRALGELSHNVIVNALVYTRHAQRFNQLLKEVNAKSSINLIHVDNWGPEVAIMLKQKLDNGEWLAILADRTPINFNSHGQLKRVSQVDFLGKKTWLPQGPFILAAILACPVWLMFGLKPQGQFQIHFEPFANPLQLSRSNREEELQQAIQRYAKRLEYYCYISPLDWFNFYDFWVDNHQYGLPNSSSMDK